MRHLNQHLLAAALCSAGLGTLAGLTPAALEGCNAPPPVTPIISSLPPLGICVAQAAVGDIVDAINDPFSLVTAIINQCLPYGVATVEQVVQWIETALASQPILTSPDAATAPDGAGTAPGSVSLAVHRGRLAKVHAAALSQMHVVIFPGLEGSAPFIDGSAQKEGAQ